MRKYTVVILWVIFAGILSISTSFAYTGEPECKQHMPTLDELSAWEQVVFDKNATIPVAEGVTNHGWTVAFVAPKDSQYIQYIKAFVGRSSKGIDYIFLFDVRKWFENRKGFGETVRGCNTIYKLPDKYEVWLASQ